MCVCSHNLLRIKRADAHLPSFFAGDQATSLSSCFMRVGRQRPHTNEDDCRKARPSELSSCLSDVKEKSKGECPFFCSSGTT